MQKSINELKKRANPLKGRVKVENKKSMEEVIENAEYRYETRQEIIYTLQVKEKTEDEINLYWLHRPKK